MDYTTKKSENTGINKIKISLLLFVLFLSFMFKNGSQNGKFLTLGEVIVDIVNSDLHKTKSGANKYLFVATRG